MTISLFHPHFESTGSLSWTSCQITDLHLRIGIIASLSDLMAATREKRHADIVTREV